MSKFETIRLLLLIPKLPMGDAVENETGEKGAGEILLWGFYEKAMSLRAQRVNRRGPFEKSPSGRGL